MAVAGGAGAAVGNRMRVGNDAVAVGSGASSPPHATNSSTTKITRDKPTRRIVYVNAKTTPKVPSATIVGTSMLGTRAHIGVAQPSHTCSQSRLLIRRPSQNHLEGREDLKVRLGRAKANRISLHNPAIVHAKNDSQAGLTLCDDF